jgi:hypothetical protein
MFVLLKLHKPSLPLRPVVSTRISIMQNVAHVIDQLLKPIIQSYSRYVKDSGHVLLKLQEWSEEISSSGIGWEKVYLVLYDVVAFYPSVGHDLAMTAWSKWSQDLPVPGRVIDALTHLLQFQLDNSFFEFEGLYYKQLTGLPIGGPLGGPLACLAAMLLETEALAAVPERLECLGRTYCRYLDDSVAMVIAESPEEAGEKA